MLSFERTKAETIVSHGTYLPVDEVAAAFTVTLPPPEGVGAIQPNPWLASSRRFWRTGLALAGATFALMVFFLATAHRTKVVDTTFRTVLADDTPAPTGALPGAPPSGSPAGPASDPGVSQDVAFSEEFTLVPSSSNLRIDFSQAYDNTWAGVDGSLVNLDTGDVASFEVEGE